MKRLALAFFISIAMGQGTITYAEDSIIGTYTGSYEGIWGSNNEQVGVKLIIASVENGDVKGTATLQSPRCGGDYPMAGSYDGHKLIMKATARGGPAGDCFFLVKAVQEGNKFVGTTVRRLPIELSR